MYMYKYMYMYMHVHVQGKHNWFAKTPKLWLAGRTKKCDRDRGGGVWGKLKNYNIIIALKLGTCIVAADSLNTKKSLRWSAKLPKQARFNQRAVVCKLFREGMPPPPPPPPPPPDIAIHKSSPPSKKSWKP